MQNKVIFKCLCGKEVTLELLGGQYQDTYQGHCQCGRKWALDELSKSLAELDEE